MMRSRLVVGLGMIFAAALVGVGCASDDTQLAGSGGATGSGTGGVVATGGVPAVGTGGSLSATGGTDPGTGGTVAGTGGGVATGGSDAAGTGGASSAGTGGGSAGGRGATAGGGGGAASSTGGAGGGSTGSVPLDPSLMSRCTGTNPVRCTIPVPTNGDYNVTVELGSATAASTSRVQAELFRIVVPPLALPAGTFAQETFSVNVRAEAHDGYSAPGMTLNVLIDGAAPALHGIGFAAAPNIPTIFVVGDSTVCDWDPALASILSPTERGWAQELSQYLKAGIAVANYADSGETAGGFYSKFYPPAKAAMRSGDYLFIQFGHNDQKNSGDVSNYKANLMKYISDARAKTATPVLFSPVARKSASTGSPGFGGLDQQVRDLAAAQNVAMVDLTMLAIADYKMAPNLSALFATPSEGTHFSELGATEIAGVVSKALKSGTLPLRDFIK